MPRFARGVIPVRPDHVGQRGGGRQDVFSVDDDRREPFGEGHRRGGQAGHEDWATAEEEEGVARAASRCGRAKHGGQAARVHAGRRPARVAQVPGVLAVRARTGPQPPGGALQQQGRRAVVPAAARAAAAADFRPEVLRELPSLEDEPADEQPFR